MILPMWHLDHVKSENLNNQRKSSLTDAVHVYYSALQWPNGRFIYLLFVLDNLGRLLQTSNASTWNKEMKYEDYRCNLLGAEFLFFFLSMKFSNGGSHLWELYYILSWHGDPPMILPNIILTCFRQWFLACHTSESEKCPCPQSLCLKFQHGNASCHRVVWSQTEDDSVSEKVQIMQVTMFVLMFAVCRAGRLPVPRCAFRRWKTYVFVWQNHPPQTRESRVLWAAHALLSPPTHLLTPRQSRGLFLSAWCPSKVSKPL